MSDQWRDINAAIEAKCLILHNKAKCLDKKRLPQNHLETLSEYFAAYNDLSVFLYDKRTTVDLTNEHKHVISKTFTGIRDRAIKIFARHGWKYYVPQTIGSLLDLESVTGPETDDEDMPDSPSEFLKHASAIVSPFDGSTAKLQGFLDSLDLIKAIMGSNEAIAVTLIKSRLSGPARDCVDDSVNTVNLLIAKLKDAIKAPSSEELEARLYSVTAFKKDRTVFTKEMEDIAHALKHAYISEGLNNETAEKYAAREAKKAIVTNSMDKDLHTTFRDRRLETISEVLTAYGEVKQSHQQMNAIRRIQGRGGNRGNGNRRNNNGNWNQNRHQNNGNNSNNYGNGNRGNYHQNNRGNGRGGQNGNRGQNNHNNNNDNRGNVRTVQGNGPQPQQGGQSSNHS